MIGVSTHSKQVDFLSVSMHRKNIPVIGNENVSTLEKIVLLKVFQSLQTRQLVRTIPKQNMVSSQLNKSYIAQLINEPDDSAYVLSLIHI